MCFSSIHIKRKKNINGFIFSYECVHHYNYLLISHNSKLWKLKKKYVLFYAYLFGEYFGFIYL